MTANTMTHDDFQAILADYLEDGALNAGQRANAEAHLLDCAECAALVFDLRNIVTQAATLPDFAPQRDLWTGIDERIETPIVSLAGRTSGEHSIGPSYRTLALAASLLVAVTAGVTWKLTSGTSFDFAITRLPAGVAAGSNGVAKNVNRPSATETFDKEISSLRTMVDERRAELDTGTVTILARNLKLIDDAIAESKAALARDPASAFLTDRLNRAYDSKLQVLRSVATMPARS
jgi:anti-sigma-K factor RskA